MERTGALCIIEDLEHQGLFFSRFAVVAPLNTARTNEAVCYPLILWALGMLLRFTFTDGHETKILVFPWGSRSSAFAAKRLEFAMKSAHV